MTYIWGAGPQPADIMLVGERPGEQEYTHGIPFIGPSGREQERYLLKAGITEAFCYKTNLVKDFIQGNPDPMPWEIERDWPLFLEELEDTRPKFIAAIGRFAARSLIGDWVSMEVCHGKAYSMTIEGFTTWVVPIYHPAGGLYNNDMQPIIQYDYRMLGAYYKGRIKPVHAIDQHPNPKYICLLGSESDIKQMSQDFQTHDTISIDTEFNPETEEPLSIQYAFEPGKGYIIKCDRPLLLGEFRALMHKHMPHVIMQASLVDLHIMKKLGIKVKSFTDTQVMAYQLQIEPQGLKPLARRHCGMVMKDYDDLVAPVEGQMVWDWLSKASKYDFGPAVERLKWKGGKYTISKGWSMNRKIKRLLKDLDSGRVDPTEVKKKRILGWHPEDLAHMETVTRKPLPSATLLDVPEQDFIQYAGRDPDATLRIEPILRGMCSVMSLQRSLKIDHDAIPMIEHMQTHGIKCDTRILKDFSAELQSDLDRITYQAQQICGHFINLNSGDQLVSRFYAKDWYGIPLPKYGTKSGRPKMDEAALAAIKAELESSRNTLNRYQHKAIELIDLVLDYRERLKLKTTYADPVAKIVDASGDGRLHSNFRITKVVSGRLSATQPNILAFPSRTELGRRIKSAFHASDGHMLMTADYSGIEMRVMAHMSDDPSMCQVFREGRDLHSETASKIFGKPMDQIDKMTERYPAKSMGFLIIYGGGGSTLQDNLKEAGLDWSLDRCNELIDEWLKVYKGVKTFMDHQEAYAKRHGFVRTMHGRIRYLPGIWSPIYSVQQEAKRMAINHPIQGSAQEIIKIAMARLWNIIQDLWQDGFSIHPLLQVHDELMFEYEEGVWDFVKRLIVDTMADAVKLSIPMEVDASNGYTWKDLK